MLMAHYKIPICAPVCKLSAPICKLHSEFSRTPKHSDHSGFFLFFLHLTVDAPSDVFMIELF